MYEHEIAQILPKTTPNTGKMRIVINSSYYSDKHWRF